MWVAMNHLIPRVFSLQQRETQMSSSQKNDSDPQTPHARRLRAADQDEGAARRHEQPTSEHQEDLLDEGLEETFPASDPVSAKRIT